jgi:KipI family sensor histidine kinase inhibitor
MTRSVPVGQVRPCGDRALLIGTEDAATGRALREVLVALLGEDASAVVVGLATVLVVLADGIDSEAASAKVHDALARFDGPGRPAPEPGQVVTIACRFDGPDLREVAELAGLSVPEVVRLLTSATLVVSMIGFSPGFAFLGGLPDALRDVPRRARPRPAVPAGSVALANGHAAAYPSASPGGWHLVGRTSEPLFSPARPPYARLGPGDQVRFTEADPDAPDEPAPWEVPAWAPPVGSSPLFTVVTPGLRSVLQDAGRLGALELGVPSAGPADPDALVLANALVGNPAGASALEITAVGPTLTVRGSGHVAVVGASPRVRLDGQSVGTGQVLPVRPGQKLAIGAVHPGLRTYLAVAGGLVGPTWLGSTASDQLSGLGPGPLVAGQALYAGPMTPPLGDHLADAPAALVDGVVTVRVVAGPHHEWFGPDALDRLGAVTFEVEEASNRVGLRLAPAAGWAGLRTPASAGRELESQGMVHGALQVPPEGAPIVLLPDHATHGGYPVVAVVAAADLGRLGQLAPGDRVAFTPIDLQDALQLAAQHRRRLAQAVVGHYPLEAG